MTTKKKKPEKHDPVVNPVVPPIEDPEILLEPEEDPEVLPDEDPFENPPPFERS